MLVQIKIKYIELAVICLEIICDGVAANDITGAVINRISYQIHQQ